MLNLGDLFQWERFITPSIIKVFYWLVLILSVLFGLSGMLAGLSRMAVNPFDGAFAIVTSLLEALVGIITARLGAELALILFRINEHLGAIRNRGQM